MGASILACLARLCPRPGTLPSHKPSSTYQNVWYPNLTLGSRARLFHRSSSPIPHAPPSRLPSLREISSLPQRGQDRQSARWSDRAIDGVPLLVASALATPERG